jgi:hypothetical protein
MYEVAEKINSTKDETELRGLAIEFFQSLVPFIESINRISAQNKQLQHTLSEVLEIKNPND